MTGSERCAKYIEDVLSGNILAPLTIKLACQRFIDDLEREDVYFDTNAANQACSNIEQLPHAKGRLQGTLLKLENWQCFFVANIFGWKWTKTNFRRFRRAYKQVPRKNGKSLLAIGVALNMFGPDLEPGAEIYLGATSEAQAKDLLFKPTKYIIQKCDGYRERFGVEENASTLVIPENFSQLKTVIRKPDDGYNPHCAVVDEYHEHETNEQYSTFDTGMGSREQPLLLVTTTAGSNLAGPCKEMYGECSRVLKGEFVDDSLFILIYEMDEGDDWADPATLRKVNPNIGISVSEDYLIDQQNIAKRSASAQNDFRTKHLNEWVGSRVAWMNMLAWQRQKNTKLKLEDFANQKCFVSIDLSSKKDLTSICLLFKNDKNHYCTFHKFYAPDTAIEENDKYRQFVNIGEIIQTPGSATDYSFIEEELKDIALNFDVQFFIFDQWQAQYLMSRLQENRLPVLELPMTVRNLSDSMKEVEARVLEKELWHDGNTCMTWQMGNVTAKMDARNNIYPRKENENDTNCHIDGPVTLIMAMNRWQLEQDATSSYETEKLLVI